MVEITLSIPEDLHAFIKCQTTKKGFHSIDDYLCNLLNSEIDRERIEGILVAGLESGEPIKVNDDWWEQKRSNLLKS